MLTIGSISFAQPWLLLALVALPAIYWLLRATPPAPRSQTFPALRLLRDLVAREETPARTPWWLVVLRLLIAALLIAALARPLVNPAGELAGQGPVAILVDNGWGAGEDWPARQDAMDRLIDQADRAGRPVILLPTAEATPTDVGQTSAADARGTAEAMVPRPWPGDRAGAVGTLAELEHDGDIHTVWLTDGLAGPDDEAAVRALRDLGGLEVWRPDTTPLVVRPPGIAGELSVTVDRAAPEGDRPVAVRMVDGNGRVLARGEGLIADGESSTSLDMAVSAEARNQADRLLIEQSSHAGAVVLLDERWRRRPVGLVVADDAEVQPLLSATYYVEQALAPYAELREGDIDTLLDDPPSVIVLPDAARPDANERERLDQFMAAGGLVLRFAGPLLAAEPDPLVPVPLRAGDRVLTGALTWTDPQPLAPFPETSPLSGLAVPGDVRIERQVLADPSPDLTDRTWARLADGTPLITGERRRGPDGSPAGWLVLVHTTASADWSNLPLSGLFVDMLRRVVGLSAGIEGQHTDATLLPRRTLDGFGRLVDPPVTALPIAAGALPSLLAGPDHPPGRYGPADAPRALNLQSAIGELAPLAGVPAGVATRGYDRVPERDLMAWLLALAFALLIVDLVVGLALRGLARPGSARPASAQPGPARHGQARKAPAGPLGLVAVLAIALAGGTDPAAAQGTDLSPDDLALLAANGTYMGHIATGNADVDGVARAGLMGLGQVLTRRTAVEPDGVLALNVERDELAFFPFLYWPITATQPDLSDGAVARLNDYMATGGTILIDTRDAASAGGNEADLRRLTAGLDIPPLRPIGPDHVLTRAFYLMQTFPGRYPSDQIWVQDPDITVNDGVSPVIIGNADWAAAWAVDESGQATLPMVGGGARQREMAYRFGVNWVMYALTGNYKADQVHVPAILERLGQ